MPRRLTLSFVSISLLACTAPEQDPAELFLDRVEAKLVLPAEARPLAGYSRSYLRTENGKVMGVFSTLSQPGRRWVKSHPGPYLMDGGCAIVTVIVDAKTEAIEQAECNGVG